MSLMYFLDFSLHFKFIFQTCHDGQLLMVLELSLEACTKSYQS
jgi:hypothetical protein